MKCARLSGRDYDAHAGIEADQLAADLLKAGKNAHRIEAAITK